MGSPQCGAFPLFPSLRSKCRAQHPEREINTYKDPVGTASLPVLVRFERKLHLGAIGRRAGGLPASTAAVSADSASWPASNGKLSPGLRSLKGNKNFCSPPPTPVSLRWAADFEARSQPCHRFGFKCAWLSVSGDLRCVDSGIGSGFGSRTL